MSVPNEVTKKSILMKVDATDNLLSAESPLRAGEGLVMKEGRTLDDYYVTAMVEYQGSLLAYSRQYSTLLIVNPETCRAENAYAMPEMNALQSMTIRDGDLAMLDRRDGKDWVVTFDLATLQ